MNTGMTVMKAASKSADVLVYLGFGPTGSKTQTNIKSLIGFADLHGLITDVSGAPQDFLGSGWVVGGAGTVGVSYFLDQSWFLDLAYTYSRTKRQTSTISVLSPMPRTLSERRLGRWSAARQAR
jgi:opacity protein-like surface antigen